MRTTSQRNPGPLPLDSPDHFLWNHRTTSTGIRNFISERSFDSHPRLNLFAFSHPEFYGPRLSVFAQRVVTDNLMADQCSDTAIPATWTLVCDGRAL
jgi:hypothetical protein